MNTDSDLNQLTERIIGCAYQVSNVLGSGFLEKVYENALALELRKHKLVAAQQHSIQVKYEGQSVGEYLADILVNSLVLVEVKAVRKLDEVHMAQCMNYLKATGLRVCLLINFGAPKVEIKRIIHGS
jgi:GxxExxY protein